jgi:hypothetical protein
VDANDDGRNIRQKCARNVIPGLSGRFIGTNSSRRELLTVRVTIISMARVDADE